MSPEQAKKLIAERGPSKLSPTEEQGVLRAAFDDQEVFNQLMEESLLDEVLASDGVRTDLTAERPAGFWQRIGSWFAASPALATAGMAVAGLVLGVYLYQRTQIGGTGFQGGNLPAVTGPLIDKSAPGSSAAEQAVGQAVFALPPQDAISAAMRLNRPGTRPVYRIGDDWRLSFRLNSDAHVLIFERQPDGSFERLFPHTFSQTSLVKAGETVWIPPDGMGAVSVEGPPGVRRVRLVALPPSMDPFQSNLNWKELNGKLAVLDSEYEIAQ